MLQVGAGHKMCICTHGVGEAFNGRSLACGGRGGYGDGERRRVRRSPCGKGREKFRWRLETVVGGVAMYLLGSARHVRVRRSIRQGELS